MLQDVMQNEKKEAGFSLRTDCLSSPFLCSHELEISHNPTKCKESLNPHRYAPKTKARYSIHCLRFPEPLEIWAIKGEARAA